jgi:hypothetical protein
VDPSLGDAVQPLLGQTELPAGDGTGASGGARFSWSAGGVDVDHYYYYGFDPAPRLEVDAGFAMMAGQIDFTRATLTDLAPVLQAIDAGMRPVRSTYVRRHHVGADVQRAVGPLLVRLDAAYDSEAVLAARNLTGVVSPTAQAVAGVEYQTGDVGKALVVEALYLRVLDPPPPGTLLFQRDDTMAVTALARWTFVEHLELEARAVIGVAPFGYVVRPQVGWRAGPLAVHVGALLLDGDSASFGHYYRRNQSGYLNVRYAF